MINLIPPTARRSVTIEYWLRAIAVWLLLLGTSCLILAILLFPTYILIRMQVSLLGTNLTASSDKIATFDVSSAELTLANNRARILTSVTSTTPFSVYMDTVNQLAGGEVEITQMTFSRPESEGKIKLTGIAKNRQALAQFRDQLEANSAFANVNLPISNLIKERDLLFVMDINLATSTPAS